jgi:hypothetical protein
MFGCRKPSVRDILAQILEKESSMATSSEVQALDAKVDTLLAGLVPQLIAKIQQLEATVAANATAAADHADDVAAVNSEGAKLDPVIAAAQAALAA